jgi:hypothetical protein
MCQVCCISDENCHIDVVQPQMSRLLWNFYDLNFFRQNIIFRASFELFDRKFGHLEIEAANGKTKFILKNSCPSTTHSHTTRHLTTRHLTTRHFSTRHPDNSSPWQPATLTTHHPDNSPPYNSTLWQLATLTTCHHYNSSLWRIWRKVRLD